MSCLAAELRVRGAQLTLVPSAGHMIAPEQPEMLAALRELLEAVA